MDLVIINAVFNTAPVRIVAVFVSDELEYNGDHVFSQERFSVFGDDKEAYRTNAGLSLSCLLDLVSSCVLLY